MRTAFPSLVCAVALGLAGGALAEGNAPETADAAMTEQERERAKTLCESGAMSAAECAKLLATALPGVGSDGLTLPLGANQLDPAERKTFAALQADSADARQFLYTRGYLRYCKQVVAGTRAPLDLPPLPKRENWKRGFLSADEATNILDVALGQKIAARLPPQPVVAPIDPALIASNNLPALEADGTTQPLRADQLTADEKTNFAKLEPGSTKATQFLYVRGYLRYCRLVIAGTIQPLQLPNLPARENWSREHLSKTEATEVLDTALGMSLVARMSKPAAQ
jgi:hypothetical protein